MAKTRRQVLDEAIEGKSGAKKSSKRHHNDVRGSAQSKFARTRKNQTTDSNQ